MEKCDMASCTSVVVVKGKPRVVLDKEDLAEMVRGKTPTNAEEAREAKRAIVRGPAKKKY
jgi:hypothetical protein